jgi:thiamine biosynthesis lipoprotein
LSWFCALVWLALASCRLPPSEPPAAGDPQVVRRTQPLLGTLVTITACGAERARTEAAVTAAFDEFRRLDALLSWHRADSELTRLNHALRAATNPVPISQELHRVLRQAMEVARETDGAFDPTLAPLVEAWGFLSRENFRVPSAATLDALRRRVGWQLLEIPADRPEVRPLRPGVSLDLGGIGKGYAVDCAFDKLRSLGVTNILVKAGGDLRAGGAPPGQTHWSIWLEDPARRGARPLVRLRDAALSTSGNYENYFEHAGRRYAHILDPRTGWPVEGIAACTVVAPTCAESDTWATALFVLGPDATNRRHGDRLAARFTLPPARTTDPWRVSVSSKWAAEFGD